jgi:hypothetical protein
LAQARSGTPVNFQQNRGFHRWHNTGLSLNGADEGYVNQVETEKL